MGQMDWLAYGGSGVASLLMLPSRAVLANSAKHPVAANATKPCSAG